ncbi:MAG TPA: membrane protein insertion efficiency factor YidD [Kiritimatiellia bacterium]|nr:membrane protein insertion efficiency factor YidD [Kiritimatiellia bacterium]
MIFLFCAVHSGAASAAWALALELAEEGDWTGARREALRVLAEQPEDDAALLLAADCALQLDPRAESARRVVEHLSMQSSNDALRARAAYRAGRAHWAAGDRRAAWTAYARAFQQAEDRALFLRSGCAMFLLRREDESLGAEDPALLQQLASCRNLWNFELRDEVRVRPPGAKTISANPATWVVGFYRTQVRPAIGHRCSLKPSCSEYFLQASRAHGVLGVPLLGDRLVREPDVVKYAEDPVESGGRTYHRDPLENHTYWMRDE